MICGKCQCQGTPHYTYILLKLNLINQTRQKISKKNEKLLDRPLFFGEALIYAKNIIVCKKKKLKMNTATLLFYSFYYPPIRKKKSCSCSYYYKHSIGQKRKSRRKK